MPVDMGPVAREAYEQVKPLGPQDQAHSFVLAHLNAVLTAPIEDVASWVSDGPDDEPGYSVLLDIDTTPDIAVPWLGQMKGVDVTAGLAPEVQREQVRVAAGMFRGSAEAIRDAIRAVMLVDDPTIRVLTRVGGDMYAVTVITRTSEVPETDLARINLVTNPSFETGVSPWAAEGAGLAGFFNAQTGWFDSGAQALRVSANGVPIGGKRVAGFPKNVIACVPGEKFAAMSTLKMQTPADAGSIALCLDIEFYTAGAVLIGAGTVGTSTASTTTVPASLITPVATAPATAAFVRPVPYVVNNTGSSFAPDFWVDSVRLTRSSTPLPAASYGDGSFAGWEWDGTAHASASHRIPTTIVLDRLLAAKRIGVILTYVVTDEVIWAEATVPWSSVDAGVSWSDVTLTDVT